MEKLLIYSSPFIGEVEVGIETGRYDNGNLYIHLISYDFEEDGLWEPFADLTTNQDYVLPDSNLAYVDDNNLDNVATLISKYNLGELYGYRNGYPVYAFNNEKIEEYVEKTKRRMAE